MPDRALSCWLGETARPPGCCTKRSPRTVFGSPWGRVPRQGGQRIGISADSPSSEVKWCFSGGTKTSFSGAAGSGKWPGYCSGVAFPCRPCIQPCTCPISSMAGMSSSLLTGVWSSQITALEAIYSPSWSVLVIGCSSFALISGGFRGYLSLFGHFEWRTESCCLGPFWLRHLVFCMLSSSSGGFQGPIWINWSVISSFAATGMHYSWAWRWSCPSGGPGQASCLSSLKNFEMQNHTFDFTDQVSSKTDCFWIHFSWNSEIWSG